MKVGDLIKWCDGEIGIVTGVGEVNGDPLVLFVDGEFEISQETIVEVVNESR